MTTGRVLAVRLDSAGDVLVTGPAVRALAAAGRGVVLLAGPLGKDAACLLPGVDAILEWSCPWVLADPPPVVDSDVANLVAQVRATGCDEAVVFTSFHQSPLPVALLLRLAGVRRISAISVDYPGSLLDVRVADPGDVPEPERALALARAAGFDLPTGDDGRLAVIPTDHDLHQLLTGDRYVVAHPGTSAPARAWPEHRWLEAVAALADEGWQVLVTGSAAERALCARVAAAGGLDLGGATDLAGLAALLRGAAAIVVANTGPAHLAAATGTPVVSLYAPTVPAARWAPYGVPQKVLGDQDASCRDTRATRCPVPGHPCLTSITAADVVRAVTRLAGTPHPGVPTRGTPLEVGS